MIYQHPLAYQLALQGGALLRAFNGEYDREFTLARLADVRALLDAAEELGEGVATRPVTTAEGYDAWAGHYDEPNDLVEAEQPVVRNILDGLPVCALALTHVPDLAPVLAEFARVLRPGGHLVISDSRMDYPLVEALPDGGYGYMPHYRRATSEYLACAIPLGLQVRRCEELRFSRLDPEDAPSAERTLPEHPSDIWTLRGWCPAAARAALNGNPCLIFWHFQLG